MMTDGAVLADWVVPIWAGHCKDIIIIIIIVWCTDLLATQVVLLLQRGRAMLSVHQ